MMERPTVRILQCYFHDLGPETSDVRVLPGSMKTLL
jgi:hypothetical protein